MALRCSVNGRIAYDRFGFPILAACLFLAISGCEHFGFGDNKDKEDQVVPSGVVKYGLDSEIGVWAERSTCCPWSAVLTDSIKRGGTQSLRMELRKGDLVGEEPKSEFGFGPSQSKEGWYAFSVYFPVSFARDTIEESIAQWQSLPDFAAGEQWRSPPLLLGVLDDSLVLEIRTDSKKVTEQGRYTFTRLNLGALDKGAWQDWVFHIRWAYDYSGSIEVWKNKELILSRVNERNSYNDDLYPYLKMGLYKWGWSRDEKVDVSTRVIFIDEVAVGDERSSFNKVLPGGL
jgi:hypothetical protein